MTTLGYVQSVAPNNWTPSNYDMKILVTHLDITWQMEQIIEYSEHPRNLILEKNTKSRFSRHIVQNICRVIT